MIFKLNIELNEQIVVYLSETFYAMILNTAAYFTLVKEINANLLTYSKIHKPINKTYQNL